MNTFKLDLEKLNPFNFLQSKSNIAKSNSCSILIYTESFHYYKIKSIYFVNFFLQINPDISHLNRLYILKSLNINGFYLNCKTESCLSLI